MLSFLAIYHPVATPAATTPSAIGMIFFPVVKSNFSSMLYLICADSGEIRTNAQFSSFSWYRIEILSGLIRDSSKIFFVSSRTFESPIKYSGFLKKEKQHISNFY